MRKFKSALILLIVLVALAIVGYWAFATLEPGSLSAEKQKEAELSKQNQELQDQVSSLQDQLAALQSENQPASGAPSAEQPAPSPSQSQTPSTTYKYQDLIGQLQKLISDNIVMKEKSQGTRVGTVQKFLQVYGNSSLKADNDYGKSTVTAVSAFQKAQGLTADGNAGPGTFQKMIDWLKQQG